MTDILNNGEWTACWKCKTRYFLPAALYHSAKAASEISFYCPYGHGAHFPAGETDEDKLRRENSRLVQRLAEKDDAIRSANARTDREHRRLVAQRGVTTRIKNRVGRGVCPCCTRTFQNLAAHMKTKHQNYHAEGPADVSPPPH